MPAKAFLALDVGEKRIGLAIGDSEVKIAIPYGYLERSEKTIEQIVEVMINQRIETVIVGYPRNQSGEATKQTQLVEEFVKQLADIDMSADIVFQDESLTSVEAERRLGDRVKDRGDIDAEAASIILQDYIEEQYGT